MRGLQGGFIIVNGAEQGELKSRFVGESDWDFDCLTVFARSICEIMMEKPMVKATGKEKKET